MTDPRLRIESMFHARMALIRPVGWVSGVGFAQLEARLRELDASGHRSVIVDLSSAHFLNASGLVLFATFKEDFDRRGGCLVLATPSWSTRRLLFEAGLYRRLDICETVSEGMAIVRGRGLGEECPAPAGE